MSDIEQIKQRMNNAEMALFSIATILEEPLSKESKRSMEAVMEGFLKRCQELDSSISKWEKH